MSNSIENRSNVEDYNYSEECPEHMTPIKQEYDFGQYDATVHVYHNCGCAVVARDWPQVPIYCTTYGEAEGIARMQSALSAVKYK